MGGMVGEETEVASSQVAEYLMDCESYDQSSPEKKFNCGIKIR